MGWKRVSEYPERWVQWKDTNYYISDEGRVKSVKNGIETFHEGTRDDRAMRICIKNKRYLMHRLVWEAWRGEVPEGYAIRHKNGCVTMNDLYNLEMIPKRQVSVEGAKLRKFRVLDKESKKVYQGLKACAKIVKKSVNTIRADANGEKKRFEFIAEGRD